MGIVVADITGITANQTVTLSPAQKQALTNHDIVNPVRSPMVCDKDNCVVKLSVPDVWYASAVVRKGNLTDAQIKTKMDDKIDFIIKQTANKFIADDANTKTQKDDGGVITLR